MLSTWPKDGHRLSVCCTPLHLCSCRWVLSGSRQTIASSVSRYSMLMRDRNWTEIKQHIPHNLLFSETSRNRCKCLLKYFVWMQHWLMWQPVNTQSCWGCEFRCWWRVDVKDTVWILFHGASAVLSLSLTLQCARHTCYCCIGLVDLTTFITRSLMWTCLIV